MSQATTDPTPDYDHLVDRPLLDLLADLGDWESLEDAMAPYVDADLVTIARLARLGRDPRDLITIPHDLEDTIAELAALDTSAAGALVTARLRLPAWARPHPWAYLDAAAWAALGRPVVTIDPIGNGAWRLTWVTRTTGAES